VPDCTHHIDKGGINSNGNEESGKKGCEESREKKEINFFPRKYF
jgi:hypothetical protein